MNYLALTFCIALFGSAYASYLPKTANLPSFDNKAKVEHASMSSAPENPSTSVYSEAAASQQGWTSPVYNGPLAMVEVRPDGTIAETAEVVAARAAHLAALKAARASNPDMDNGQYDPHKYGDHEYGVVRHAENLMKDALFYGSLAKGHFSEAKAAKEAGLTQAKASAAAEAAYASWMAKNAAAVAATSAAYGTPLQQNMPYFGPLAMLQVLETGFLADTPEVAAARRIHLNALAEAQAAANLWKTKNTKHESWS